MRRSRRLRLKDIRSAYRLLMECRELGHDPLRWRRHMFTGLCRLVGAHAAAGGDIRDFGRPNQKVLQSLDVGGWARTVSRYLAEDGLRRDPVFSRFARLRGRVITRRLEDLIDTDEWHRSRTFQRYMRPAGVDSRLISFCRLNGHPRVVAGVTLHRALGDGCFGLRDARLVHYFHHEMARLLGDELTTVSQSAEADLPQRLRQVLCCLMEGDSEKQVALRLRLSIHTVHTYVRRLHLRFGVQSRGELLARGRHLHPEW